MNIDNIIVNNRVCGCTPEVFKQWVATQTWVALAFSLGRGPFRDPKNKKIKKNQPYYCQQTTTKPFFNQSLIKMS